MKELKELKAAEEERERGINSAAAEFSCQTLMSPAALILATTTPPPPLPAPPAGGR